MAGRRWARRHPSRRAQSSFGKLRPVSYTHLDVYKRQVFTALWVNGANLNDPAVTAATLVEAGFDPTEIFALINDADIKAALKANTEDAVARGVFGAPTVFVGDAMFFGQDLSLIHI